MTNNKPSKISRRDALKILTAATGATALANLPSKWNKPGLEVGVLPAHAQTSVLHILQSPPPPAVPIPSPNACSAGQQVLLSAVISPPAAGILLRYVLAYTPTGSGGTITSPVPSTGSLPTNASGQASLTVTVTPTSASMGTEGVLSVAWSFVNPSDGANIVSQNVDIQISCQPIEHILLPPSEAEFIPPDNACLDGQPVRFTAEIAPPTEGILLQYALAYFSQDGTLTSPVPSTGSLSTNASGQASVIAIVTPDNPAITGTIGLLAVEWSFVNPADGSNTVSQDVGIDIGC